MTRIDTAIQRARGLSDANSKSLRANGVYDKLAILVGLTFGVGFLSYRSVGSNVAVGQLIVPAMVVAMGAMLIGQFRPTHVKVAAPIYAVAEGIVLGVISKAYSSIGGGIVPTAIVATSLLFAGCLFVFRTGVVKVTPRFVQMTSVLGISLFGLYVLALFGLRVPGIGELGPRGMVFGIVGLGVGLAYLFIDFDRVRKAEDSQMLGETAEWFMAFQLLLSLVMIYVNVLRVLASSQRRR